MDSDILLGDDVQVTAPLSSFKGCVGVVVDLHATIPEHYWVLIEGWSPMIFGASQLVKL